MRLLALRGKCRLHHLNFFKMRFETGWERYCRYVQSQILDLFKNLKAELDLAMILISHDIDVIAEVCDNVSVIRKGAIVEQGVTDDVLTKPQSDYTTNLMVSMPGKQWL